MDRIKLIDRLANAYLHEHHIFNTLYFSIDGNLTEDINMAQWKPCVPGSKAFVTDTIYDEHWIIAGKKYYSRDEAKMAAIDIMTFAAMVVSSCQDEL